MAQPMTLFATQLEELEQRYIALLQADLRTALDAVTAYWSADPLTLPNPVEYHGGNVPDTDSIFTFVQDLPAITVEVTGLQPIPGAETFGEANSLIISAYVQGDSIDEANKLAHRFGVAIATVLTNRKPDGVKNATETGIDIAPTVSGGYGQLVKGARVTQKLLVPAMLL